MKKTFLYVGLSLPFLFISIAGAKELHHGFVDTHSQVLSTAHKISGRAEKGATIHVLQDKRIIATGKADHAGKFNIHIKKVLPLDHKYFIVSSKHGYKVAKKGFLVYRTNVPSTTTTPASGSSNTQTPVASSSSSSSSASSSSSSAQPTKQSSLDGKITISSIAPDNTTDVSGHQNGDVWYVQDGSHNTTAMYEFNNGTWQSENSNASFDKESQSNNQIIIPNNHSKSASTTNSDDKGYFTTSSTLIPDNSIDSNHRNGDIWYQKNDVYQTCAIYIFLNNSWKNEASSISGSRADLLSQLEKESTNISNIYPAGSKLPEIIYSEYESLDYVIQSVKEGTDF